MVARELRYGWFEEMAENQCRRHCRPITRTTAWKPPAEPDTWYGHQRVMGNTPQNGHIVRPLLCLERKEIISYLNRMGQDYVTDSTNLQDEYTVTKIRLNLLPMMQKSTHPSKKAFSIPPSIWMAHPPYKQGIDEGIKRVTTAEGICIERLMQELALNITV